MTHYLRRVLVSFLTKSLLLLSPAVVHAEIPAFPGAEGAGAFATGGRPIEKINYFSGPTGTLEKRGIVYHVTTLDSDPAGVIPGSLRYGMSNENFYYRTNRFSDIDPNVPDTFDVTPRIIVFDVGGTIDLSPLPPLQHDIDITPMNFTIAGQTAPGGITIHGGEFNPAHKDSWDNATFYPKKTNNLIVRNLAIRSDDPNEKDGLWFATSNSIADHITSSWYTDEGVSITDSARNVTVQYSIVGPGWNSPDGDGSQLEGKTSHADISVHHNLYIHNDARVPRLGEKVGVGVEVDFRNNVIYDFYDSSAGYSVAGEPSFNNMVNNYYIGGTGNSSSDNIFDAGGGLLTRIYQSGNLLDLNMNGAADGTDYGWAKFAGNEAQQAVPYVVPHGVTQPASEALASVQGYVGARWWDRDFLDQRTISQLATFGQGTPAQTGYLLSSIDPADINAVVTTPMQTRPAGWDTDNDGMPDYWEAQHGLNPNSTVNASDWNADFDSDGYINVEEYVNEIAEWPAPYDIIWTGGNNRYAAINNWSITRSSPGEADTTTHWQPSRFDTAVVNAGTATVDAVGQHAKIVRIATGADDTATLTVIGGWLKVEQQVVIGGTATSQATLNLSGGELSTPQLSKGAAGTFNFTGGVLHADVINFSLTNNGGTLSPGHSPGVTQINGDLTLNSGVLEIEIGGTQPGQFDVVVVSGVTHLGGTLKVTLVDLGGGVFVPQLGNSFGFLASGGGTGGMFSGFDLPALAPGLGWAINPGNVTNFLTVVAAIQIGDYNGDNVVDAADYTVWRDTFGQTGPNLAADGNGDGEVNQVDFGIWKNNFGHGSGAGSGGSQSGNVTVPEPATSLPLLLAVVILVSASKSGVFVQGSH